MEILTESHKITLLESFYDFKYWNINYYVKCLSEKCWFLVCCFFSAIWNYLNIIKMPKRFFLGNYFWNLETPVFIFYVFITEIYLMNIWHENWCSVSNVLKGLCFYLIKFENILWTRRYEFKSAYSKQLWPRCKAKAPHSECEHLAARPNFKY